MKWPFFNRMTCDMDNSSCFSGVLFTIVRNKQPWGSLLAVSCDHETQSLGAMELLVSTVVYGPEALMCPASC